MIWQRSVESAEDSVEFGQVRLKSNRGGGADVCLCVCVCRRMRVAIEDTFLPMAFVGTRSLRFADGPDEALCSAKWLGRCAEALDVGLHPPSRPELRPPSMRS